LLAVLKEQGLRTGAYKPVNRGNPEILFRVLENDVRSILTQLKKLGFSDWSREASRALSSSTFVDFIRPLNCTVKTHKAVLSVRLLHSSNFGICRALSTVIHRMLEGPVAARSWLAKGTADIVTSVLSTELPVDRPWLGKLDIDDFYLSGEHSVLVKETSACVEVAHRRLLESLLWFVLATQFVQDNQGETWQVVRGSGMGEVHSGSVADLSFARLVEDNLDLPCWGIRLYRRFRDDIFFVADSEAQARVFTAHLVAKAAPHWRVSIDRLSDFGVPMLDTYLYVGPGFTISRRLDVSPFIKPTAVHIPLSWCSAHPGHTHEAWPLAEVKRIRRLSRSDAVFNYFRAKLLARWRRFFMKPSTLCKCAAWPACPSTQKHRPLSSDDCFRLVIRFHPGLTGLSGRLNRMCVGWQEVLRPLNGGSKFSAVAIQVSFSKADRQLFAILR